MCMYYYHVIITYHYKVKNIQEKNYKVSDCSSI